MIVNYYSLNMSKEHDRFYNDLKAASAVSRPGDLDYMSLFSRNYPERFRKLPSGSTPSNTPHYPWPLIARGSSQIDYRGSNRARQD